MTASRPSGATIQTRPWSNGTNKDGAGRAEADAAAANPGAAILSWRARPARRTDEHVGEHERWSPPAATPRSPRSSGASVFVRPAHDVVPHAEEHGADEREHGAERAEVRRTHALAGQHDTAADHEHRAHERLPLRRLVQQRERDQRPRAAAPPRSRIDARAGPASRTAMMKRIWDTPGTNQLPRVQERPQLVEPALVDLEGTPSIAAPIPTTRAMAVLHRGGRLRVAAPSEAPPGRSPPGPRTGAGQGGEQDGVRFTLCPWARARSQRRSSTNTSPGARTRRSS